MMKKLLILIFVNAFILASVSAKTKKRRDGLVYGTKKRVVINFEDELLEGNPSMPGIFNFFQKKEITYGRLVKFRKDFLPEMRRTAREM